MPRTSNFHRPVSTSVTRATVGQLRRAVCTALHFATLFINATDRAFRVFRVCAGQQGYTIFSITPEPRPRISGPAGRRGRRSKSCSTVSAERNNFRDSRCSVAVRLPVGITVAGSLVFCPVDLFPSRCSMCLCKFRFLRTQLTPFVLDIYGTVRRRPRSSARFNHLQLIADHNE